jgi:hypothetical protein
MATQPPKDSQALAKTLHPEIMIRANLQDLAHLRAAFEQPHPQPSVLASWFRPILTHALGALLAAVISSALVAAGFILKAEGAASAPHQCEPIPPPVQHHMPHKKRHSS